jgi:hypothetical protein
LCLLGFSQLNGTLLEYFVEVGDFLCPRFQIGLDKALCPPGLGDRDLAAFLVEP